MQRLGFQVWGLVFRVQGSVWVSGFGVLGSGVSVQGFGYIFWSLGFRS